MPFPGVDILSGSAGAAFLGGGADFLASRYLQRDSQRFNAAESRAQRDWSERMSNTQYQRAADDLEKAGLNRILALGSPAGVPHGATASSSATSVGKTFSDIPKTGIAAATAKQSIEQSKAETRLKSIQAQNEEALRPAQEQLFLQQAANQREQAAYWSARAVKEGASTPFYQTTGDVTSSVRDALTGKEGSSLNWLNAIGEAVYGLFHPVEAGRKRQEKIEKILLKGSSKK